MACAQEQPIELAVDTAASAMLAGAIGFALSASAAEAGAIVAAGVAGFVSALAGLRAVPIEARRYALPAFQLPPIPAVRKSM